MNTVSLDFVLEHLEYVRSTGLLLQKKPRSKISVGSIAGSVTPYGYRYIQLAGKKYAAHRLVWLIEHGSFPKLFIDHIDGNKLNNKIENLREATSKQNNENKGVPKNSKTGVRGVSYNRKLKKYVAQIQHNGVGHYLGIHDTLDGAREAYLQGVTKFFTHHKPT